MLFILIFLWLPLKDGGNTTGDQQFLKAVADNDVAKVEQLLERGANPEAVNENGWTALHVATANDHLAMMEVLLRQGARVDAKTVAGLEGTALMFATSAKTLEKGKLLIKYGAKLNLTDRYGDHALNWAAYQGNLPYVMFLVENGGDLALRSRHGTALEIAIRRGNEEMMHYLADAQKLPAEDPSHHLILQAVIANDLTALEQGLGNNRNLEIADRFGRGLLALAVLHGHQETLRMLLRAGVKVNAGDCIGFTPLMLAVREGQASLVGDLLKAGAAINQVSLPNSRKLTALHLAIIWDRQEIFDYLLSNGADVNLADANGNSPLMLATGWGRLAFVETLMGYKADPNAANNEGLSPLEAARNYNLSEIQAVLESKN